MTPLIRLRRWLLWLTLVLVTLMLVFTWSNFSRDSRVLIPPASSKAARSRANAQARRLIWQGNRFGAAGDYRRAYNCYRQALALARKFELRERALAGVHALGILYHERADRDRRYNRLPDLDSAEACYRRALEMSRLLENARAEAAVLIDLGILYARSRQEPVNGELLLSEALRISQQGGVTSQQAFAHYYRGVIRSTRQALEPALADFAAACSLFQKLRNRKNQARAEEQFQLLKAARSRPGSLPPAESLWSRPLIRSRPDSRED